MKKNKIVLSLLAIVFMASGVYAQRFMENLDRGVYALYRGNSEVFVSWRMLVTDPENVTYNVYLSIEGEDAVKRNDVPISNATWFVDELKPVVKNKFYTVRSVIDGKEQEEQGGFLLDSPFRRTIDIPLQTPTGYTPNDAAVGDLNGDGRLDFVLKQELKGYDNSQDGICPGSTKLEGYTLDGDFLWRIDLGKNIREGAHYTPFIVYDLNNDGFAEIAVRTAEGTIDGIGNIIGDVNGDGKTNYVNSTGRILSGPEFISVFDGKTGKELARENYIARGSVTDWGDNYGNRVDRFLMGVAYLDGENPSLIICRGYYNGRSSYKGQTVLTAMDYNAGVLTKKWTFRAVQDGLNSTYSGQGNHNLSIGDVDGDGRDEILYGAMAVDDDGTGLYTTRLGHGDAIHLSDIDPNHEGLELFMPHEDYPNVAGLEMRDADSGELLWGIPSTGDVGRGVTMDIDPAHDGYEVWGYGGGISGLYSAAGERISDNAPNSCNFGLWWDGDLLREQLDGTLINKWNPATEGTDRLVTGYDVYYAGDNNGTKKNPCFSGDFLGDWREEVAWRADDNKVLRIVCTTQETDYRMYSLTHDPIYRISMALQNIGYNQPPHPGFYLGAGMTMPAKPNIKLVESAVTGLSQVATQERSFTVYPNPAKDRLTVKLNNVKDQPSEVTILNVQGQQVFKSYFDMPQFDINLSDLHSGMFFLKIKLQNHTFIEKFIKK